MLIDSANNTFAIHIFKVTLNPRRNLNLQEYQSKSLLQESGVAIQEFRVLGGRQDAKNLADFSKSAGVPQSLFLSVMFIEILQMYRNM